MALEGASWFGQRQLQQTSKLLPAGKAAKWPLRVMSYNILADTYANHFAGKLYRDAPHFCLQWPHRGPLLCKEITYWGPDVICLQEVEHYHEMESELSKAGYDGQFLRRSGRRKDGCATFWRRDRLQLLGVEPIMYNTLKLEDNVALLLHLQPLQQPLASQQQPEPQQQQQPAALPASLVVANTHICFDPSKGDVKLGQIRTLMCRVDGLARRHGALALVCGDFNTSPHSPLYSFMSNGSLDVAKHCKKKLSGQQKCFGYAEVLSGIRQQQQHQRPDNRSGRAASDSAQQQQQQQQQQVPKAPALRRAASQRQPALPQVAELALAVLVPEQLACPTGAAVTPPAAPAASSAAAPAPAPASPASAAVPPDASQTTVNQLSCQLSALGRVESLLTQLAPESARLSSDGQPCDPIWRRRSTTNSGGSSRSSASSLPVVEVGPGEQQQQSQPEQQSPQSQAPAAPPSACPGAAAATAEAAAVDAAMMRAARAQLDQWLGPAANKGWGQKQLRSALGAEAAQEVRLRRLESLDRLRRSSTSGGGGYALPAAGSSASNPGVSAAPGPSGAADPAQTAAGTSSSSGGGYSADVTLPAGGADLKGNSSTGGAGPVAGQASAAAASAAATTAAAVAPARPCEDGSAAGGWGVGDVEVIAAHPLRVSSAYVEATGSEPAFSSSHREYHGTCDYIWFTPFAPISNSTHVLGSNSASASGGSSSRELAQLLPVAVLAPPDVAALPQGLPAPHWGSDHVCLLADFDVVA